jgi:hypothetical protein
MDVLIVEPEKRPHMAIVDRLMKEDLPEYQGKDILHKTL